MLVSGLACFCGAVVSRRGLGIVASGVMLLAMLDLSLWGVVPALLWATLLLVAGGALGFALRPRGDAPVRGWRIGRATALVVALSYLCMAWLVVAHGAGAGGSAGGAAAGGAGAPAASGHGGHALGGSALGLIPLSLSALLALILVAVSVIGIRRGRRGLALEAGGMAIMLAAMLAMTFAG